MRSNSAPAYSGASARIAGQRGIEIGIGHLDQMFQFGQFVVGQVGDLGIGEPAEDQIHLAGAAMPAAKQQPLAAVIEAVARSCRSRHFRFQSNAKNPDVPGGVDIAMVSVNVSSHVVNKFDWLIAVVDARIREDPRLDAGLERAHQSIALLRNTGLPRSLRVVRDDARYAFAFSRQRFCPRLSISFAPSKVRGRGE